MVVDFIERYSSKTLEDIQDSKILRLSERVLVMLINKEIMFTLVDISNDDSNKQFQLTIETNDAGKTFASYANGRFAGLKNSEMSTFEKLYEIPFLPYEKRNIKFITNISFKTSFYDSFKDDILA